MDKLDIEGFLNLQQTASYRVLREGHSLPEFMQRLKAFKRDHAERFEKLLGICSRLEFAEQLRYIPGIANSYEPKQAAFQYQTERLCAYLTTTCIEILAGRHIEFPVWLSRATKATHQRPNIAAAINELATCTSEEQAKLVLVKWTNTLHNVDYKEEYGLNKAFKQFFYDLPLWIKEWLSKAYFIEKVDVVNYWFDKRKSAWMASDVQTKTQTISGYLYKQVRNKFTHTVEYYPSMENGGVLYMNFGGAKYGFNTFYKGGLLSAPLEYDVGIAEGYAESDILRMVIVYSLRQWLDIDDNEDFIQDYWKRSRRRRLIHILLQELRHNMRVIEWLCAQHIHIQTDQFSWSRHVGELNFKTAKLLEVEFLPDQDRFIHTEIIQYNRALSDINNRIREFNTRQSDFSAPPTQDPGKFIEELTRGQEIRYLVYHLRNLQQVLPQLLDNVSY